MCLTAYALGSSVLQTLGCRLEPAVQGTLGGSGVGGRNRAGAEAGDCRGCRQGWLVENEPAKG